MQRARCRVRLSTRALQGFATQRIGIDPAEAMLRVASTTDPEAQFLVGRAEDLPFRDGLIDPIAAAGSLNYTDVAAFFLEARRVWANGGYVFVYDFSAGRSFTNDGGLDRWVRRVERARSATARASGGRLSNRSVESSSKFPCRSGASSISTTCSRRRMLRRRCVEASLVTRSGAGATIARWSVGPRQPRRAVPRLLRAAVVTPRARGNKSICRGI